MDDFSLEKFSAELIRQEQESLLSAAGKYMNSISANFKIRFKKTFTSYISGLENKYSTSKTIIYRDTPHRLRDFYTPLDLKNNEIDLSSPNIADIAKLKSPVIITGSGGTGKSTLLKHLMLTAIELKSHIPIFIELRKLEDGSESILSYIYRLLKIGNLHLPIEYIGSALERGNFSIFFDGLDELSSERFISLSDEIKEFSVRYGNNTIVVSSRQGYNYESWLSFVELSLCPLSKGKACQLINSLKEVDEKLRTRFVSELQTGMFEKHTEFLTNPLLLSMMFLTYKDNADIPTQLHNFYDRVFQALYNRHDVITKEEYVRPTKTGILADQAESAMSAFSIITYIDRKVSFKEKAVLSYLERALTLSGQEFNPRDLIDDLIRAFCMLLQDGTHFQYAHRSFQEYFSALFFVRATDTQQRKLLPVLMSRIDFDNTIPIAYGLNKSVVERLILVPWLESIKERISYKKKNNKTVCFKLFKLTHDSIGYDFIGDRKDKSLGLVSTVSNTNEDRQMLNFITKHCLEWSDVINPAKIPARAQSSIDKYFMNEQKKHTVSEIARNPEISNLLFKYGWFANIPEHIMNYLDHLQRKIEEQKDTFNLLI
jgi:hypothetical protein